MTKTILVVEDEKPMAEALRLKLEKIGYSVSLAPSGVEVKIRNLD